jgi:uridine kinase
MVNGLIASERLQLSSIEPDLNSIFDKIVIRNSRGFIKAPVLIGIDGSVTAGKSFTANKLYTYLLQHNMNCVLIHGDWFMSPRRQRKLEIEKAARESYAIADYDTAACQFDKLKEVQDQIQEFVQGKNDNPKIVISNAYDRATGECDKTISMTLPEDPIIIFEGTGILGPSLYRAFDLSIRVDIDSYEGAIERLEARELEKESLQRLDPAFVKRRYDLIDYPYDMYLRSRDRKNFDVLLDTSASPLIKIYHR